jgi:hypothetical protein
VDDVREYKKSLSSNVSNITAKKMDKPTSSSTTPPLKQYTRTSLSLNGPNISANRISNIFRSARDSTMAHVQTPSSHQTLTTVASSASKSPPPNREVENANMAAWSLDTSDTTSTARRIQIDRLYQIMSGTVSVSPSGTVSPSGLNNNNHSMNDSRSTSISLVSQPRKSSSQFIGLRNIGNSCYMNSIIQVCMSSTICL